MNLPVQTTPPPGALKRGVSWTVTFYSDVMAEMKKVTWPDWPQVRQLSIGVVILSVFVGFLIFILDNTIQLLLVRLLPKLFT